MSTIKQLNVIVLALTARVDELELKLKNVKIRDRGPASTRTMSEADARRVPAGLGCDLQGAGNQVAVRSPVEVSS